MKAEERHDLKTNELAQWISTLPQQIMENLQTIIYVTAAIVLIAAAVVYYLYQKDVTAVKNQTTLTRLVSSLGQTKSQIVQAQTQGVDLSYNLIQSADELDLSAQNLKSDSAAALALIKRGEALRMELHYRPTAVSKETLVSQINIAKASYEKAVEKAHDDPSLMAKAKYGLGLCDEEIGDFAAAAKTYQDIVNDKNFEGTVGAAEAKYRLAIMSEYEKPVAFKPAPPPSQPAAAPQAPLGPLADVPAMQAAPVNAPSIAPMPEAKPAPDPKTEQK